MTRPDVTEAIGRAVAEAALKLEHQDDRCCYKIWSQQLSQKYRPDADILAVTFDERTNRSLAVNWGVFLLLLKHQLQQMKRST